MTVGVSALNLAVFQFDSDSTATMFHDDENNNENGSDRFYSEPFTWSVNNDGTVNFVSSEGTLLVKKLSEKGNRIMFKMSENGEHFIREYYRAMPLSLADMNGKHFAMDDGDDYCSAGTFSFSGSVVTLNEQCREGFSTLKGSVAEHSLLDDTLVLSFTKENGDVETIQLSLIDGSLAKGEYAATMFKNSLFDNVGTMELKETDAALTPR